MLSYEKAKILVETWIGLNCEIEADIIKEDTITKLYGWVFFYQSKSYLKTQDFSEMLVGNAPILVDRFNGNLKVLGTARTVEDYLLEYEKTLPEAGIKVK